MDKMLIKRQDIFYADLGEGVGSEQEGVRPVLILQNDTGNKHSTTVIVASITSQLNKSHLPTHVQIDTGTHGNKYTSIILLEQIRTVDKSRLQGFVSRLDNASMDKVDKAMMISLGLK